MHQRRRPWVRRGMVVAALALAACARQAGDAEDLGSAPAVRAGPVRPGISVLLDDSVHLVRGKRVGLLTNHTGLDEQGRLDIDLLHADPRARAAEVRLVRLFAPEHGIRGTEDREDLESGIDERSGLPIVSLYTAGTIAPPDSTLRDLDVLVFDLQDIGTRTWTYVGNLVYSLRAVKRADIALVVLDRPAPLGGRSMQGPMLDSAIANVGGPDGQPGIAWALWPMPLRHGLTMGELARFYNAELGIGARLHVVPMAEWRRALWFDDTKLHWVRPSPNIPTLASATLYPAVVPFEATNVSVGRGTPLAHQLVGFPGMNVDTVISALRDRELAGVRFEAARIAGTNYGAQQPYRGVELPGVRIVVTDRERLDVGRLGTAIVWALRRTHPDSFRITDTLRFDRLIGSGRVRRALMAGDDPDAVIDRELPGVMAFERRARQYFLYR